MLPIPVEIEQSLRHILAKNTEGESMMLERYCHDCENM
jgi:hypothetical protein